MRLDKFLSQSRIIKRRTLAKQYCDQGLIKVNGSIAKAGKEINNGDRITVIAKGWELVFDVLEVPQGNVPKKRAGELYQVLSKRKLDER